MELCGWTGTILRVDLTSGAVERQALDPTFARAFLGGQGFAEKLVFDAHDFAERDPLSARNVLCIAPGALSGTLTPGSGRGTVAVTSTRWLSSTSRSSRPPCSAAARS